MPASRVATRMSVGYGLEYGPGATRRLRRPLFVGVLGADLRQIQTYRHALDAADDPQEVKDDCLPQCRYDWVGVTVAETERKALEHREARARRDHGDPHGATRSDKAPTDEGRR